MRRREARECAFSLLFQMNFWKTEEFEAQIELFFDEQEQKIDEDSRKFIETEAIGAFDAREEIDRIIDESAKDWTTQRMSKVDLNILRLAVYEIKYRDDIPNGVAVNEAVEIAKKYSSDEAPAFINGILAKISNRN